MATIKSKDIVTKLITNNGHYLDDLQVVKIVRYTDSWGGNAFGLIYKGEALNRYDASEFIIDPQVIFEAK